MTSINIGNVEIVQLLDADLGFPFSNVYPEVSAEQWEPYWELYPRSGNGTDGWKSNAQCYALRSGGETLLIDTGLGPGPFPWGATGNLVPDMRAKGIQPESVDRVIFTHLHGDHVGWNMTDSASTFPNARYLVPEVDWEYFRAESRAADNPHMAEQIEPLERLGVMELVSGEQTLTDEITAFPTPGHTPGHQSFAISSAGERAVILGDVAHHPGQVEKTNWNAGFDDDGTASAQTRTQMMEQLEASGSLVAACHFPAPGLGHVVRVEGKRIFRAL